MKKLNSAYISTDTINIPRKVVKFILLLIFMGAATVAYWNANQPPRDSLGENITVVLSSLLLIFSVYGVFAERFKPSFKSLALVSSVLNFLMCGFRCYMIFRFWGESDPIPLLPMMISSAFILHVAIFAATLPIYFLYIKLKRNN